MRNLNLLLTLALSFAASTSAFALEDVVPGLVARQDNSQTPTPTNNGGNGTPTQITTNNPSPTGGEGDAIQGDVDEEASTDENTEPVTTTDKNGSTITMMPEVTGGSGTNTTSSKKVKISANAQAGGVQMKKPAITDGYQIFKIGDPVTFSWNFTSVQVQPTRLNIQAYCTDGMQYFPIAMNMSADTTQVVWDTEGYQATGLSKLPVATYTLMIYDETRGVTAIPSPGYLSPFSGLTFGMYYPREATPLSGYECPTCDPSSAALIDPKALRFILGMGVITALSFVWFIAGAM